MFVGETGSAAWCSAPAMHERGRHRGPDGYAQGARARVIDLPTIQKKLNLHYHALARPVRLGGLDQRGKCLQRGVKGRYRETQIEDDHQLKTTPIRCSSW